MGKFVKKSAVTGTLRIILIVGLLIFCFLPLAACSKTEKTASSLELTQQNDSMTISLNVTSTFNNRSTIVDILSEYTVIDVPVIWTGVMFNGGTYEDAKGNVSSTITGFLSADGTWIESMTFTKTIVGQSMMGITYEVKLRNIPLTGAEPGQPVIFLETTDVSKYVTSIKYEQKGVIYVSSDWDNVSGGQPPVLKFKLEKGDPNKPRRTPPSGGM
jgi:hypothetical protein